MERGQEVGRQADELSEVAEELTGSPLYGRQRCWQRLDKFLFCHARTWRDGTDGLGAEARRPGHCRPEQIRLRACRTYGHSWSRQPVANCLTG